MSSKNVLSRREFLRNAVMLAGAGVTAPLWSAMKYDRNAVLRYFREYASETENRVKEGIEANRKGDATLHSARHAFDIHCRIDVQTSQDFACYIVLSVPAHQRGASDNGDVLLSIEPGKQSVFLEHHRDLLRKVRNGSRGRLQKACKDVKQGSLSAA